MDNVMALVMKPLMYSKWIFVFGLKTVFAVVNTWAALVRATVMFHVHALRRIMIWIVALIFLPLRVFTTMQREKLLESCVYEMHIELDHLNWVREQLEDRLQTVTKERSILEAMLAEVDEENDLAIAKIQMLESELHTMKLENVRLKNIMREGRWSSRNKSDENEETHSHTCGTKAGEGKFEQIASLLKPLQRMNRNTHDDLSDCNSETREVMAEEKKAAILRSFFSTILCVLVRLTLPEVNGYPRFSIAAALLTVVVMSLKSAVQYFYVRAKHPHFDAVALFSLNWFLLGTLAYPVIPKVAYIFVPWVECFLYKIMGWASFR